MAFKLFAFAALLAVASAGHLGVGVGVGHVVDYHAPANYDFAYSVNDPHTGDAKGQQETRHGDVVKGSYSLVEPDGSKRVVHYAADPHNGFNAVVHREPNLHPVAVKAVAPAIVAAPAIAHVAGPVGHAAVAHSQHVTHVGPVVAAAPVLVGHGGLGVGLGHGGLGVGLGHGGLGVGLGHGGLGLGLGHGGLGLGGLGHGGLGLGLGHGGHW